MSYAAPSYPPSGCSSSSPGHSNQYATPTSTPTPGRPLLLNGKMLVYPNSWQGCFKCQDTGFRHGDPSHPCRKCWQSYGQVPNPLLMSSAGMRGAKLLQKPLPMQSWMTGGSQNGSSSFGSGRTSGGYGGYPGSRPVFQQAMSTGGSFQNPQMTGMYHPSPQPPPPELPRRQSPPRVNRAEDAGESLADENGEAPPAYDDAVAAGPDGILPPQRRDELESHPTGTSNGSLMALQSTGSSHASHSPLPGSIPGSFSPPPHPPPMSTPHHNNFYPANHPPYGPMAHHPYQPRPATHVQYNATPPPGALILQPGDPRIGGQLCYKCGGSGVKESLWFGDETCSRCNGLGRLL